MDIDAEFRELMRAMSFAEGTDLLKAEETWRCQVPESFCAAGLQAVREVYGMPAAAPSNVIEGRFTGACGSQSGIGSGGHAGQGGAKNATLRTAHCARKTPRRALLLAAILALSFALGFAASPLLRECVSDLLSGLGAGLYQEARRTPADYTFPSPGEGYTVTQEYADERVKLVWFHGEADGGCELLAEAAYVLPADVDVAGEMQAVLIGGVLAADYAESGDRKTLLLRDGDVSIVFVLFRSDQAVLMDYAEKFARENGL